ncbi:MAG: right-handed parallel beta-helix repeat-containing protein, partial [Bacteroidaceae bacterium]|nr:right-handed parallel beta-helix repeat-containing protein [Bacteroidaceae bacterium]
MRKSAYLLAILLLCTLWACDSYDSWTVDPSARLTFSSDTVSFDTIISKVGSSTRRLLVFNNNSAGIRLTNVRLKHGADSYFRINVDGQFLEQ